MRYYVHFRSLELCLWMQSTTRFCLSPEFLFSIYCPTASGLRESVSAVQLAKSYYLFLTRLQPAALPRSVSDIVFPKDCVTSFKGTHFFFKDCFIMRVCLWLCQYWYFSASDPNPTQEMKGGRSSVGTSRAPATVKPCDQVGTAPHQTPRLSEL